MWEVVTSPLLLLVLLSLPVLFLFWKKISNSSKRLVKKGEGPSFAIIGAGFGGLHTAFSLKERGLNFTIYEKSNDVGGTWLDNTYPGCACDVPSYLYSYSHYPNKKWTRKWSSSPEILAYIQSFAKDKKLYEHIKFNTEVIGAKFDEKQKKWKIKTSEGEEEADFLITCVGQLNQPKYPSLEGLDSFKGVSFHSARWNHDVDLKGKKVAVIGNGASAIQFVAPVAKEAGELYIFQRTPSYILPKEDFEYSGILKALLRYCPFFARMYRIFLYFDFEKNWLVLRSQGAKANKGLRDLVVTEMEKSIKDPQLREKAIPTYTIGCKRILISNDYLTAIQQPNAELIVDPIQRIEKDGIVAGDKLYDVDVIIYSTGFHSTRFLYPMEIQSKGKTLNEEWQDCAKAYW
eukprot:CAMPEP_0174261586 /NCGR_PEP_ID=MMETSP0439-20130205/11515_1 /TAXON_ID=0 /ORGANISM="Stereomyxa ramosa, Strain Chinc5" /LENGTH=402 /DNA_ID=CAMNT_0015346079 /DNA_START=41 /DNA_END=1246 /DNA_ORIENTATION=+